MTKLSSLRARLEDLRRRRQLVRWSTAYAALALAVFWTLAAAFLADWCFEMTRPQRLLSLAICLGVIVWAARRFTLPWLGQKESELDIALLVEKQQRIDSDLVAAIQFESAGASEWGSTQLEGAVVDYVAEFGKGWNILEGFSRQELVRRAGALTATVGLLAIAAALFPHHAGAFLNRFFLGSAHYPTRTVIDTILVNNREIDWTPGENVVIKVPYGKPLRIVAACSGELPEAGRADLVSLDGATKSTFELAAGASKKANFAGQLSRLVDPVYVSLHLGDAWTDPAKLQVIALPVVETKLTPTPPAYVKSIDLDDAPAGARQLSVIEGSRVELEIACMNKALKEASLMIAGESFPLRPVADSKGAGRRWRLDAKETPFARVAQPVRYEIQVVDEDDQSLEHPLEGLIRIKADQRPRVSAEVVTKHILPTATPIIEYRANDDYGIGRMVFHLQRVPAEGAADAETPPERVVEVGDVKLPLLRDKLPLVGAYRLNLETLRSTPGDRQLRLVKGDQLKITMEVFDYRGPDTPGMSATSEPLVLQVTDESGILAAISESDERSARQLDAIIKRQLGIGETK